MSGSAGGGGRGGGERRTKQKSGAKTLPPPYSENEKTVAPTGDEVAKRADR